MTDPRQKREKSAKKAEKVRLPRLTMCSSGVYLLMCVVLVRSIPLDQNQDHPAPASADTSLPYNSYLQQVVEFLEKDPHFREKLRNADMTDITDGKLSRELEFVHHSVRTRLDELKREEMVRLRMLLKAKKELKNNGRLRDQNALLRHFQHLDFSNPHSFEIQDLEQLIKAATKDLQEVDQKQHEAFKQYEMMKEHERRERMKNMSQEERNREERHHQELKEKHADHPRVNHPGSEDQLKEVWHETDGLETEDFNPKTFFRIHDSNRDGYFDESELEALFTKELEKVYDPEKEEDDLMELEEERLRMREHVFKEVDLDKDGLISEDEFLKSTTREDFHQNQEWQTLDQGQVFSEEELLQFEERLSREHEKIYSRDQELQRQRQELEERQRELDDQRRDLQQAMEQMEKLKGPPPDDQNHQEQTTTEPHQP